MSARTTQVVVEVAERAAPNARLTQMALEVAERAAPNARLTQVCIEVAVPSGLSTGRVLGPAVQWMG